MSDTLPEEPIDLPPPTGAKAGKGAFAFILITVLLDVMALGIVIPVWPALIIQFNHTAARAGIWVGISGTTFAVMQFFCQPIIGALSDKIGRRPVVLASNLGTGIDWFVMALSPTLWFLLVGRLISGATSATFGTAAAYIADTTEPEKRAGRFGMMGAVFGLGFLLGPGLGGLLGDPHHALAIPGTTWVLHGGTRVPFFLAGCFSLMNFAYGFFVLPESLPKDRRDRFRWSRANPVGSLKLLQSHPDLLPLAFVNFLAQLAHLALQTVFTLHAASKFHWGSMQIGLAMMAMGACGVVVQGGLTGPLVKLLGERRAIFFGLFFGAVGFAIYAFAPDWKIFMLGVPIMSLWGVAGPAVSAIMTRRVGVTEQGKLQGANQGVMSIALIIGPAFYGSLFWLFNDKLAYLGLPGFPFIVASFFLLCSLAMAARAARGAGRREAAAVAAAE
ncbi:MAG TPA: MFS transporter [Caulobacteraceae bacterium]|jgi:DHA1 family tetracycline resistance protein-like MFS transporter|nr:MFS transporter [Caulobacteraceae bacterium]